MTDTTSPEIPPAVRTNTRTWEQLRVENPIEAKWLLLDAYVARVDVSHEWSSVIRAERLDWARSVVHRLLREGGAAAAARIPQAMHLLRRFVPGEADAVRAAPEKAAA